MTPPTRLASMLIAILVAVPAAGLAAPKSRPKPKPAFKPSAKSHMDRAAKAHKAGDFPLALSELQAAYEIKPQPKLLYAIAQVYAKLENCPEAITHYEQFLTTTKDKKKQQVVKEAIAACKVEPPPEIGEATILTPTPPEPPPEPLPSPPPPEPLPPSPPMDTLPEDLLSPSPPVMPQTARAPWYKDKLGDALVISGVAASVVSFVVYSGAVSELDDAETAPSLDRYNELVDSAHSKRTVSIVLAGGGIALIGAGVMRYALRGHKAESQNVVLAPIQGGGLVTWSGGF